MSFTHKKWHQSVVSVKLDRLLELVPPEAQLLVRLDVADLDQADETSLLNTRVGLKMTVWFIIQWAPLNLASFGE